MSSFSREQRCIRDSPRCAVPALLCSFACPYDDDAGIVSLVHIFHQPSFNDLLLSNRVVVVVVVLVSALNLLRWNGFLYLRRWASCGGRLARLRLGLISTARPYELP